MISAILYILMTFVVGGIPFGFWIVKAVKGIDLRNFGSGSTGATNAWRAAGRNWGLLVFFLDTLKGLVPTGIAVYLDNTSMAQTWNFAYPHLVPAVVAAAALIGHSRSVFLNFTGGKSAATGLGTLLALSPLGGLATFLTFLTVMFTSKYVSLASVLGVFSCGFWFALFGAPVASVGYCVIGFIWVTYRHIANLKRILNGTEPKINDKKKPAASETTTGSV